MDGVAARIKAANHGQSDADHVGVTPLLDVVVRRARGALVLLAWAAGAVLLIACFNLAGTILAQGLRRTPELSIRFALGATRFDVCRELLIDAAALALPALAAGLMLASVVLRAVRTIPAETLPRLNEAAIDWPAALVALGLAIGATTLAALVPALVLSRRAAAAHLRARGASAPRGQQGTWMGFVAGQTALTLLLLAGTGLLLKSLAAAWSVDLGYQPARVLAVDVSLPASRYSTPDERVGYYDRALERLAAAPAVASAAVTSVLPDDTTMMTAGTGREHQEAATFAGYRLVSPRYFATLGIPVVRTAQPLLGASAYVDRAVADKLWKQSDPLGTRFYNGFGPVPFTAAGIVGDVREWDQDGSTGTVYVNFRSFPDGVGEMHVLVRYRGDQAAATAVVRRTLLDVDPLVPFAITPLASLAYASTASRQIVLASAAALALVALLLAVSGIYALVAFALTRRLREAAIRLALGGRPVEVVRRLAWLGVRPALAGLAVGLLAWPAAAGVVRTQLFRVQADDPLVLSAAIAALSMVAAGTALVTARGAGRADPVRLLHDE